MNEGSNDVGEKAKECAACRMQDFGFPERTNNAVLGQSSLSDGESAARMPAG